MRVVDRHAGQRDMELPHRYLGLLIALTAGLCHRGDDQSRHGECGHHRIHHAERLPDVAPASPGVVVAAPADQSHHSDTGDTHRNGEDQGCAHDPHQGLRRHE
jgi:hypothetical protein